MEKLIELENRINHIDYRLRILERFLDVNGFIHLSKQQGSFDSIKIEVLNDMRKEIKDLKIEFSNENGTAFYQG